VQSDWALRRPIETILSGPAASVVGAWHLAGRKDAWVVDVGGTTTDIAVLRGGLPRLNPEGARVGGWRTMIETIDVHTVGLGGDSHVRLSQVEARDGSSVTIGPRRVAPLCWLSAEHEGIARELRQQLGDRKHEEIAGQFALARRAPSTNGGTSAALLEHLEEAPRSLVWLARKTRYGVLALRELDALESSRLLLRSAFTPTDALHVLGHLDLWDAEASRLGAEMLAMQGGVSVEEFCQHVAESVSGRLTGELVAKVLGDEEGLPRWHDEPAAAALLTRACGRMPESDLTLALGLRQPVLAVGAPVEAYLPRTADQLGTELIIPPHAPVANALGAVAGGVVQHLQISVRPTELEGLYQVHLPDGVRDVRSIEAGIALAEETVPEYLESRMREAGAARCEVSMARDDRTAALRYGWGESVLVETVLLFTASGPPDLSRR